jgi:hypothetical protein
MLDPGLCRIGLLSSYLFFDEQHQDKYIDEYKNKRERKKEEGKRTSTYSSLIIERERVKNNIFNKLKFIRFLLVYEKQR